MPSPSLGQAPLREEIRLKLVLHYDGARFHGWQIQREERTVQGELERVVERLTGARRSVTGSGRTDRGVHATGQVAAVTVPARWTPAAFHSSVNALLPDDIWVESVERVRDDFHPRYDATARTYEYRVGTAAEAASPFRRRWCWPLIQGDLDEEILSAAAGPVVGEHSFRAFAKSGQPERGDRCTVSRAEWRRWDDPDDGPPPARLGSRFEITADRYLHHMVRYLVGTMVDAARGRRPLDDLEALLAEPGAGELETSPPAPPEGLFLVRVEYPAEVLDPEGAPEREVPPALEPVPDDEGAE